jgi:hypothetical protein
VARLWNQKTNNKPCRHHPSTALHDAHIGINSGARGEVKPCIVTINAIKKIDNGGGIVQSENYEGLSRQFKFNFVEKDFLKEKKLSCLKHGKRHQKWQEKETQQNGNR